MSVVTEIWKETVVLCSYATGSMKEVLYYLLGIWSSQIWSFLCHFKSHLRDKSKMLLEFRRVFWHLYLQELLRAELIHLFLCPECLIEKLMSIYMMEQLWCVFSPVNFPWAQRQANQLRKTGCNMHQEQRNLVMFSVFGCFFLLFRSLCRSCFPSVLAASPHPLVRPLLSPEGPSFCLCSPGLK